MAKYSCINHPEKDYLLVLRNWQMEFCNGDKVAAGLLSIFEYWHNIKYEKYLNKAEEKRQPKDLLQFHSETDLIDKMLSITHTPANIRKGINFLKEKQVISIHRNPSKRYAYDRTRHFLLHPEVLNEWLQSYGTADATEEFALDIPQKVQPIDKKTVPKDSKILFSLLQNLPLKDHIETSNILENLHNPALYQAVFDEWQHALNKGQVKNTYAYLSGLVKKANQGKFNSTQSQHQQNTQKIVDMIEVDREKPTLKQAHDIFPTYEAWRLAQSTLSQQVEKSEYMNFVLPTRAYESDQAIFLRCANVYAYDFMESKKDKLSEIFGKPVRLYMG